jgi:hypothetical protein
VGGREAVGDLRRDVDCACHGEPFVMEELPKRPAVEQLRHHERHRVVGADVVDGEDVRMVERSDRARLLLEPPQALGIARNVGRQHLDGHIATETQIARAVDLAHPASAERRENLVRAEPGTRAETHEQSACDPSI